MKTIFISGAISNMNYKNACKVFLEAQNELLKDFDIVINPTKIIPPETSHQEAMRVCLEKLTKCTHIFMMNNWVTSKGARLEYRVAKAIGLEIIYG